MNAEMREGIEPSVAELDLERIAWKVSQDPFKPDMSEEEILSAVNQYRRFLSLRIRYPMALLVPTDDIDLIWHTHILDTESYAYDCQRMFGRFLHHNPYFGEFGSESQGDMEGMFNETSNLWAKEFGEALKIPEIFRCAGKACHAPSNCRCR